MKNKKNKEYYAGRFSKKTLLGIILIGTMVFSAVFTTTLIRTGDIEQAVETTLHGWQKMTVTAMDVDPGDGNDGIVNIYVYPLASKSDVDTGCSEGTAYAHGDNLNGWQDGENLTGDVSTAVTWFIAVEVQFSDKAYNTTSSDWDKTLVKCVGTSTDLSISAEEAEEGSDFFDQDGTTDAKLTFYWDNSDSGWQITTGATYTFDDFDIYYYA